MPGPRRMRLRPTAASHSTSPAARSKRLRAEKALARDVEEAEAEPFFVGGLDPQRLGVELAEAPEVEMLGRREVRGRPRRPPRRRAQEGLQMLADDLMEHDVLGVSRSIHRLGTRHSPGYRARGCANAHRWIRLVPGAGRDPSRPRLKGKPRGRGAAP